MGYSKHYDIIDPDDGDPDDPKDGTTWEVKFDEMFHDTGNFAFEYYCKGRKSGVLTTTSNYWVHATRVYYYVFETPRLKEFLKAHFEYFKKVKGGDNNERWLILVPEEFIANKILDELVTRILKF